MVIDWVVEEDKVGKVNKSVVVFIDRPRLLKRVELLHLDLVLVYVKTVTHQLAKLIPISYAALAFNRMKLGSSGSREIQGSKTGFQ